MHFAKSASELLSVDQISQLSGLEFIQDMLAGKLPAPPICQALNYTMESAEFGKVVFRGTPSFEAMNPIGSIHGGWFGTLLDSCMACSIQTQLPKGTLYTTLEYKVNIIRGLGPDSEEILAIGTVSHVGRKTGVAEGRIIGADSGKLYATGSTTCLIFERKQAS